MQIDLADTDTEIHQLLSYRLAQHGITSPRLLAQLEYLDLGTMLKQHSRDAAHYPARLQEIAARARIRTALNTAKACSGFVAQGDLNSVVEHVIGDEEDETSENHVSSQPGI